MSRQKYWPSLSSCSVCPALFSRPMLLLLFRNRHEDLLTEHGEDFCGETTRHVSHVCFLFARLLQVKCWIYLFIFLNTASAFCLSPPDRLCKQRKCTGAHSRTWADNLTGISQQTTFASPPKKNKKNLQLTQHLLDHMGFFPLVAQ